MNAIELLAEAVKEHPEVAALRWVVDGAFALANLEDLGQMGMAALGLPTLVVVPPPKAVPIINKLHAAGWKRGDIPQGCGFWVVYADLKKDGAHIRVAGMAHQDDREVGHDNPAVPFFAPLPPPLPARGRLSKALKAERDEWLRKCREDEW